MVNQVPIVTGKRAQLAAIAADSKRMGIKEAVPTAGYLRSEVLVGAPTSAISFPLRTDATSNGQPVGSTERRLSQNDAFYATGWAIMWYSAVSPLAGQPATQAERARARLQQFPNSAVLGLNAPELEAAMNGKFTLTQNNKIWIREADMWSMQYVDQAQQGVAGAVASALDFPKVFLETDYPMIRLNGQSDIDAIASFPDAIDPTKVALRSIYSVLYIKGWLVQNGGVARSIEG